MSLVSRTGCLYCLLKRCFMMTGLPKNWPSHTFCTGQCNKGLYILNIVPGELFTQAYSFSALTHQSEVSRPNQRPCKFWHGPGDCKTEEAADTIQTLAASKPLVHMQVGQRIFADEYRQISRGERAGLLRAANGRQQLDIHSQSDFKVSRHQPSEGKT